MKRLTDEEVYLEWIEVMGRGEPPLSPGLYEIMVRWVGNIRVFEPRINSGVHLADYCSICDEDDDMDSFYGQNYFEEDT